MPPLHFSTVQPALKYVAATSYYDAADAFLDAVVAFLAAFLNAFSMHSRCIPAMHFTGGRLGAV